MAEPADTPVDLHVARQGQGPPMVFSHGYGDTSATWAGQVDAFSPQWTTVVWDLPGHGRSPASPGRSFDRDTVLVDLGDIVGNDPAVLVGHSLGGYLSLLFAIRHPSRVRALVLVATGPGFRDEDARRRWNEFAAKHAPRMDPPAEVNEMVLQQDAVVIDGLADIDVPVLHIVGGDDTRFHAGHAAMDRAIADARGVTIDGAGHEVHQSHAEQVNRPMTEFLEDLPPGR